MNSETTHLSLKVDYDPELTDPARLATALDRLIATVLAMPGIFDEYGNPKLDEFFVIQPSAVPYLQPPAMVPTEKPYLVLHQHRHGTSVLLFDRNPTTAEVEGWLGSEYEPDRDDEYLEWEGQVDVVHLPPQPGDGHDA